VGAVIVWVGLQSQQSRWGSPWNKPRTKHKQK